MMVACVLRSWLNPLTVLEIHRGAQHSHVFDRGQSTRGVGGDGVIIKRRSDDHRYHAHECGQIQRQRQLVQAAAIDRGRIARHHRGVRLMLRRGHLLAYLCGIFETLEQGADALRESFEPAFGTPHGVVTSR